MWVLSYLSNADGCRGGAGLQFWLDGTIQTGGQWGLALPLLTFACRVVVEEMHNCIYQVGIERIMLFEPHTTLVPN